MRYGHFYERIRISKTDFIFYSNCLGVRPRRFSMFSFFVKNIDSWKKTKHFHYLCSNNKWIIRTSKIASVEFKSVNPGVSRIMGRSAPIRSQCDFILFIFFLFLFWNFKRVRFVGIFTGVSFNDDDPLELYVRVYTLHRTRNKCFSRAGFSGILKLFFSNS